MALTAFEQAEREAIGELGRAQEQLEEAESFGQVWPGDDIERLREQVRECGVKCHLARLAVEKDRQDRGVKEQEA